MSCAEGNHGSSARTSLWLLTAAMLAGACSGATLQSDGPANVLILLTDDQGVDQIGAYAEHPDPPATPRMDALADQGVLFRNAWSYPTCSPTRAALLTGRLGRRTGVGDAMQYLQSRELPLREITLPEVLATAPVPYASSAVGKWHLSAYNSPSGVHHPNLTGFEFFTGSMANLYDHVEDDGRPHSFFHWERITNGVVSKDDTYATTATVDDALARIEVMPEPWLLYVAFNAPHTPWDPPPSGLHEQGEVTPQTPEPVRYRAAVEALDHELGRLLDEIDPSVLARTTILFAGDNGTPAEAVREPWNPARGKQTPYEGGVNVPLVVAGAGVHAPGESAALVHVHDLFATALDIAGADPPEGVALDSESLLPYVADPDEPGRDIVYTERFVPSGPGPYEVDWRMSRTGSFKVVDRTGQLGVFDLRGRNDDGELLELDALPAEDRAAVDALIGAQAEHWSSIEGPAPL